MLPLRMYSICKTNCTFAVYTYDMPAGLPRGPGSAGLGGSWLQQVERSSPHGTQQSQALPNWSVVILTANIFYCYFLLELITGQWSCWFGCVGCVLLL
jgi:hypothetical protein